MSKPGNGNGRWKRHYIYTSNGWRFFVDRIHRADGYPGKVWRCSVQLASQAFFLGNATGTEPAKTIQAALKSALRKLDVMRAALVTAEAGAVRALGNGKKTSIETSEADSGKAKWHEP